MTRHIRSILETYHNTGQRRTGYVIPSVKFCTVVGAASHIQNVQAGLINPASSTHRLEMRQRLV
jgi:hypothetical protein